MATGLHCNLQLCLDVKAILARGSIGPICQGQDCKAILDQLSTPRMLLAAIAVAFDAAQKAVVAKTMPAKTKRYSQVITKRAGWACNDMKECLLA